MKKALLYLAASIFGLLYMIAWDTYLPELAREILRSGDPLVMAKFWLTLTSPLWVSIIGGLFLWILKSLDKS